MHMITPSIYTSYLCVVVGCLAERYISKSGRVFRSWFAHGSRMVRAWFVHKVGPGIRGRGQEEAQHVPVHFCLLMVFV